MVYASSAAVYGARSGVAGEAVAQDVTLADVAGILGRAKGRILLASVAGAALAFVVAFNIPDRYEVRGLLMIDDPGAAVGAPQGARAPAVEGLSVLSVQDLLGSEEYQWGAARTLLPLQPPEAGLDPAAWAKAQLRRLVAVAGGWVRLDAGRPAGVPAEGDPQVEALRRRIAANLTAKGSIESGMVALTYLDTDPQRAADLLNGIMDHLVVEWRERTTRQRARVIASIEDRLERLRREIAARSGEVARLRQQIEMEPTPMGTVLDQQVAEATRQLAAETMALAAARARHEWTERSVRQGSIDNNGGQMPFSILLDTLRQDRARAAQRLAALQRRSNEILPQRQLVGVQERQLASLQAAQDQLTQLLEQHRIAQRVGASAVRVVAHTVPPSLPAGPRRPLAVVLAGVVSGLGAALAALFAGTVSEFLPQAARYRGLVGAREIYPLPVLPRRARQRVWRARRGRSPGPAQRPGHGALAVGAPQRRRCCGHDHLGHRRRGQDHALGAARLQQRHARRAHAPGGCRPVHRPRPARPGAARPLPGRGSGAGNLRGHRPAAPDDAPQAISEGGVEPRGGRDFVQERVIDQQEADQPAGDGAKSRRDPRPHRVEEFRGRERDLPADEPERDIDLERCRQEQARRHRLEPDEGGGDEQGQRRRQRDQAGDQLQTPLPTDHAAAVEPAVQDGLLADEDALADGEGLRMAKARLRCERKAVAEALDQRAQGGTPHQPIDGAVGAGMASVKVLQLGRLVPSLQLGGQRKLVSGTRLDAPATMDGRNDPPAGRGSLPGDLARLVRSGRRLGSGRACVGVDVHAAPSTVAASSASTACSICSGRSSG